MQIRTDLPLLMANRDMTQTELSIITGIPRVYIVYIVGGRMLPDDSQLEKICQALKVTSDMIYPDPAMRDILAGDKPKKRRKPRTLQALHDKGKE
ncbi:MAG: helix-turn-helix domain-containing protein [Sphaerochaeta sp.]|jgi:DNA-binding Xre family transcriptional regulator|nr:helix-turn-helix domain-containing protein [Sphaerochaeta sp.]